MAYKKSKRKEAAEMAAKQIQKDMFKREEALDANTINKIKEKWFEILFQSKMPEMRENLRNVLDYMEKLVEVEVFRHRLFEEERMNLNDQIQVHAQSHSKALDALYDLYLQRIHELHRIYTEQVSQKKTETDEEFRKTEERQVEIEENLKALLYQMEINQENQEDSMKCSMFLKMNDEKSKNTEKSENMRVKLERFMEKKWHEISNVLVDYQQSTEHRRNHYAQLKARDLHDSKIIHSQIKKTQKLYDEIQQLKTQLENPHLDDEQESLPLDFREEREKLYNAFMYLKKVTAEEMKMDDANLRELSALSKRTIDHLMHILKKGEKIVSLYSLCLKHETEKEKIVPVGGTLYTTKIPDHLMYQTNLPFNNESSMDIRPQAIKLEVENFQNFWQKVGKVQLSMIALMQCIHNMEAENKVLTKVVQRYFKQMSTQN